MRHSSTPRRRGGSATRPVASAAAVLLIALAALVPSPSIASTLTAPATTGPTTTAAATTGSTTTPTRATPDPRLLETRNRFFGRANVDQRTARPRADRIVLSWFGVTNFAMAIRGHVVLLDAWVPRGVYSGYVPTDAAELARLRPSHVYIGHGHWDHAMDAVPIARASGATLVGSAEHCAFLRREEPAPDCVAVSPADAGPGSTRRAPGPAGVAVTAMRHVHSGPSLPSELREPFVPLPSPTILEHPTNVTDALELLSHLADPEGGTLLYRFEVGDHALTWNDSAGPLEGTAAGDAVVAALRAQGPADVQVGAIQGFNQFTNGLRDPMTYVRAIRPRVFVPTHHDDWQPGITTRAAAMRPVLERALQRDVPAAIRPELRFIEDPRDYVRPDALTFAVPVPRPVPAATCVGPRRVRAALTGDVHDVRSVRFLRAGAASRVAVRAPFARTLRVRRAHRMRAAPLRARVRWRDGTRSTLRASSRTCR
ncbi:MAG: hypothetical protein M0P31_00985 [Solirubrobacteraceae bacterium]|nr:hypothetical protein [Solirubrobacteraceae bacterium]